MIPTSSSSSSGSAAIVRVEKATSEFLIGPDWTMNIDICDTINSNHWLAKDVVRAVKKRLQHKNPNVNLLALTLLETMVKNCGDYVHFQIVERNILQEMIKIVKKKADMRVREKILVLLDSWQEAFGGPGGKHPQYYWAYEELRQRSGVEFPHRSSDSALIFTPPINHPTIRHTPAGYGMPSNSSTRLDEAMASEMETLSLSSISSMRDVLDLLSEMLKAVNPNDRVAVKDEVIIDLVNQCRENQKRLMQMLTTTGDEELLGQGLELNDGLQTVLAKHDTIAAGSPLPNQVMSSKPQTNDLPDPSPKPAEYSGSISAPSVLPSAPLAVNARHKAEEEEEEDDFAQLARRHSKMQSPTSQSTNEPPASESTALALPDPPIKTKKDQDMIEFLSITLSTAVAAPHTDAPSTPDMHQAPAPPITQGYPQASQTYPGNQGQVTSNNYVTPWARPQQQPQSQPQMQPQPQMQMQPQSQYQQQVQWQQPQVQTQSQYSHFQSGYPPPPWAATPGYYNSQNSLSTTPYTYTNPQVDASRPVTNGGAQIISTPRGTGAISGQKPFIPSYRLFEDLNVLGNNDERFRTNNTSSSLSGTSSQSMVGGRK